MLHLPLCRPASAPPCPPQHPPALPRLWAQAKQEFLAWQRRRYRRLLTPGDLLSGASYDLRPCMLPFWLFSVRARVEYRGSVGSAAGGRWGWRGRVFVWLCRCGSWGGDERVHRWHQAVLDAAADTVGVPLGGMGCMLSCRAQLLVPARPRSDGGVSWREVGWRVLPPREYPWTDPAMQVGKPIDRKLFYVRLVWCGCGCGAPRARWRWWCQMAR